MRVKESCFFMMRLNKLKQWLHYYTFPRWSAEFKYLVLLCSCISCFCGAGGAFLVHQKNFLGVYMWHAGLVALLFCSFLFIKGTYRKYLDRAWDTYY